MFFLIENLICIFCCCSYNVDVSLYIGFFLVFILLCLEGFIMWLGCKKKEIMMIILKVIFISFLKCLFFIICFLLLFFYKLFKKL